MKKLIPRKIRKGLFGLDLKNIAYAITHPKEAVYSVMVGDASYSNTSGTQRSLEEIKNGLNTVIDRSENRGIGRDLPSLYLFGNDKNKFEELPHYDYFDSKIRKSGRDPYKIKTYKGNINEIEPEDIYNDENYAKEQTIDGWYFPQSLKDNVKQYVNGKSFGGHSEFGGDDVAAFAKIPSFDKNGNLIINYADYWDFDPGYNDRYNTDWLGKLEVKFLDKIGTPFILHDKKYPQFVDWDTFVDKRTKSKINSTVENISQKLGILPSVLVTPDGVYDEQNYTMEHYRPYDDNE